MTTRTNEFIHLDFLRGLAALLVMAGHLRAYLFVTPDRLTDAGIPAKAFYFVTGFGHEAVIIFFAMSGFFITKSITGLLDRGAWSWRYYMVQRISRLWTVLVPALVLTLILDMSGILLSDGAFYAGEYATQYARGPGIVGDGTDLSISTFFGNLFFLQDIHTPIYGTNYPLWSLSYEFWYYVLFPLAFVPFAKKSTVTYKVVSLVLFCVLVWWLPRHLLLLGLVWLLGALTYLAYKKNLLEKVLQKPVVIAITLLLAAGTISAVRAGVMLQGILADLLVGLVTCCLLITIIRLKLASNLYAAISEYFAKISYTLYAIHDPVLAFTATVFLANHQRQFDLSALSLFIFLFCMIILFSYVIYWLFERNTARVAKFILSGNKAQ